MKHLWTIFFAMLFVLPGCGAETPADDTTDDDDSSNGDDDDAATDDDDTTDDDDSGDDDDSAGSATISGEVTRSLDCTDDCIGTIYLAILSENPVSNPDSVVANGVLVDADLTTSGAPFSLTDIPPRPEVYYITAFFDDDGDTDPKSPGPDTDDLTATEGFGVPTILVETAGEYTFTIDLNMGYPF